VYLADSSLPEDELPPIVQGDVWERRIIRVAARAKELVSEAAALGTSPSDVAAVRVGGMTVEQLERLIASAIALAAAGVKTEDRAATPEAMGDAARSLAGQVLEGAKASARVGHARADVWRRHVLWVDDRPENNAYERSALEELGIEFTLALSTREALGVLAERRFGAIISDMGRNEGPREGYVLLEAVRASDVHTPFFIYAGSSGPAQRREAIARGAQGLTNAPRELFDLVVGVLGDSVDARMPARRQG
jgi:CheY-like chemotaxis protein